MTGSDPIANQEYLRTQQYRTADKLRARIQLHRLFGTNHYPWQRWVFDQLRLEVGQRVLELGCGPGDLWRENLERIPAGVHVVLSDLSAGMLQTAGQAVGQRGRGEFNLLVQDAQAIALKQANFDWVIANHMLYHLPDLRQGLQEIQRVLKPGGWLCAATNGYGHMRELSELIDQVLPGYLGIQAQLRRFALENAATSLEPFFGEIRVLEYLDDLEVTQAEPLLAYIASLWGVGEVLDESMWRRLEEEIQRRLQADGRLVIHKSQGVVLARKEG